MQNELNKREKLKNVDIKSSLKTASIALFILLIVCAITSLLINEKTNEALAELLELDLDIKTLNFLDYALLSHLVKLKYQVSTSYLQNGIADISGGVFATLAIPFVIFLVLGILRAKRDLKEDREFCLMNSFLVGLFYGIGLLILTLFSLIKTEVPVPFSRTILTITKKYSSIAALLNGLIIAMVFYILGYGLYMYFKKESNRLLKYRFIFNGTFCLLLGYIISLVVYIIGSRYLDLDIYTDTNIIDLILHLQLPAFIWNTINYNAFAFLSSSYRIKLSLLSNNESIKYYLNNNILIAMNILPFIPFILYFIQGRKERKIGKGNMYLNLAFTSITYSLLMTFFAAISNINIKFYGQVFNNLYGESLTMTIGFKPAITFVTCLIFSYGISLAGGLLTKPSNTGEVLSYNE